MVARVWLTIEETADGKLVAYGNGGKNGNAGQPLVTYQRTEPANPARLSAWGEELATDTTMVARLAIRAMLDIDPDQAVMEYSASRNGEAESRS